MRRLAAVLICWGALFWGALQAQIPLAFQPVDAQYSPATGKIVMVSADSNLHIYDPASHTDTTVPLSYVPLGVSVSPDGYSAAVMHNGWVSYVNLQSHAVETFQTAIASGNVVLSSTYIYVFPSTELGPVYINLQDQSQGTANAVQAASARFDAVKNSIYGFGSTFSASNVVFKLDVSSGMSLTAGPSSSAYPISGNVWFSSDGNTIYTGAGTAFRASDMSYAGSFSGLGGVQSLSAGANEIAAIPAGTDTEVRLYESAYLNQTGRFVLPDSGHGKWVFFGQDGTQLYVIAQAASYELDTIDLTNPAVCAAGFGSNTSVSVAASGALENASIESNTGCAFQATSSVGWIQLVSGQYGSGATTLNYVVRPNTSSQVRIGTIMLNSGGSLTVVQAGSSGPSLGLVSLSVNPSAADYSKALDKLVYVSAAPNELHLYDPNSQTDTFVSLVLAPTSVSVDPSGMYAAVGHDGWISYVNLQSMAVQRVFPVPAKVNGLAIGNGNIYFFPNPATAEMFTLNVSTGAVSSALDPAGGQIPRLSAAANALYVSGGELSMWDLSQASPVVSPSAFPTCGNLWLSEDATRIYTGCGAAYSASNFSNEGYLSNAGTVQWAADSKQNTSLAVIPLQPPGTNGQLIDSQLQVYSDTEFTLNSYSTLPSFQVSGANYTGHGKYVFWNNSESSLIVVEQADSPAPLISNYAVYVTPCSYSVGAGSMNIPAAGSASSVQVITGRGCAWAAQPQAAWIQVTNGSGVGTGALTFTIGANSGTGTRTGTITVAGQTVTISQPPALLPQVTPAALAFGYQQTGIPNQAWQTVKFNNTGFLPILFASIGISGSDATDFSLQGNTCGTSLPAGGSCTVTIAFQPTGAGSRNASLNFVDNAGSQSVSLTGSGIQYLPVSDGSIGPTPQTGDYDGDGKADFVVWRPATGFWYVLASSNPGAPIIVAWGLPGDIPVPGDYDGDRKTDFAVWRPSEGYWYILPSSDPGHPRIAAWGLPGDLPVPGDYDGDGKTDLAVWRPSEGYWYILPSSDPAHPRITAWGLPGDVPMVADFDGDGKDDLAVWRPSEGTWYILPSSNPGNPLIEAWGVPGDLPQVGNFEGPGRPDVAVWRPENGGWYVLFMKQPFGNPIYWGLPGDIPR